MSSNLKVNTILPSTGTTVTVSGISSVTSSISAGSSITGTTFYGSGANLTSLPSQATIANNADNRVITGGSGVNLNGEANLTFDGNTLQNLQSGAAANLTLKATSNSFNSLILDSNRTAANDNLSLIDGRWNGTVVSRIQFITGSDTSNKDDGYMAFHTRTSGASLAERLRITSDGNIGAGGITSPLWTAGGGIHLNDNYGIGFGNGGSGRPDFQLMVTDGSKLEFRCGFGADTADIVMDTSGRLLVGTTSQSISSNEVFEVKSTASGFSHFRNNSSTYAPIYIDNEASNDGDTLVPIITVTDGGGNRAGFLLNNSSDFRIEGAGAVSFGTGGNVGSATERLRIDNSGHVSLRNSTNSHQEIQWYSNTSKSATIGWGNGSANWEFKHYRQDNQADNPYANIDFFTGSSTSPTRALRITEDGNHIREKHSRFACQITYQNKWYSQGEIIQFNTHVNVGNDFDNSNNKYTAPVDGTYYFFFHTNVIRNGSGTYYTDWYKNGSNITTSLGGRMYDYYTGSGWNNLSGFIGLDLQEGDYISVHSGSADTKYDGNTYGQLIGYLVG